MIDTDKYFFNGEITDGKVLRQELINDLLEDIIKTNKDNKKLKEERNKLRQVIIMTKRMLREIATRNPISNCWTSLNNCDECEEKNDCEERPDVKAKRILSKINDMEKSDNEN